jgi:uncharacterized protein (DUF2336 family)
MSSWPDSEAPLLEKHALPDLTLDIDTEAEPVDRVRRAARLDCSTAALRELARDPEIIVRATVALNLSCDSDVDTILAADQDERVRALLGGRIARLLPDLDAERQSDAARHIHATLTVLATDQATQVRAAIADEIATMDAAPRALVLHLARDITGEVSDQIVRLSPVLRDTDLLALLDTPASPHTAESIASRKKLSSVVADAIVQQADAPTIRALLSNQSACIRESTLDALIGRAPNHIDWHAPLVRRPSLSAHAVRALSGFIASDLLRILATRVDLDPSKLEIVRQRLAAMSTDGDDALIAKVRQLQAESRLNEASLQEAIESGDSRMLLALLAVSSGVTLHMIDRLLELRSAKALVSLVWTSGFSMALAVNIQRTLCQFGPDTIIHPTSSGGFPLSKDEMGWQIELMGAPEPNRA